MCVHAYQLSKPTLTVYHLQIRSLLSDKQIGDEDNLKSSSYSFHMFNLLNSLLIDRLLLFDYALFVYVLESK